MEIDSYVGYSVVAYIRDIDDKRELISITPRNGHNESIEAEKDCIEIVNGRNELWIYDDQYDGGRIYGTTVRFDETVIGVTNGMDIDKLTSFADVISFYRK